MNYKYYIKKLDNSYYYGLYPNNNNRQPVAVSGGYPSREDAKKGIEDLKNHLKENNNPFQISINEGKYYFELKANKKKLTFKRILGYTNRENAKKGIDNILKNVGAPLKVNNEVDLCFLRRKRKEIGS